MAMLTRKTLWCTEPAWLHRQKHATRLRKFSRPTGHEIYYNDEQKKYRKIIAPGMLAKHYSPTVPLRINAKKAKKNELLIGFGPNYDSPNLSFKGDLTEAASNLFSFLAKYQKKYSKIAIAPIPNIGIGRAINDRIKRASKN